MDVVEFSMEFERSLAMVRFWKCIIQQRDDLPNSPRALNT
jgi:hypothetical protein